MKPTAKDRDTCLCKTHENLKFKLETAKKENMLITNDLKAVVEQITCSSNEKECMYRECVKCKDKKLAMTLNEEGTQVKWHVWKKRVLNVFKRAPQNVR